MYWYWPDSYACDYCHRQLKCLTYLHKSLLFLVCVRYWVTFALSVNLCPYRLKRVGIRFRSVRSVFTLRNLNLGFSLYARRSWFFQSKCWLVTGLRTCRRVKTFILWNLSVSVDFVSNDYGISIIVSGLILALWKVATIISMFWALLTVSR